MDDIILGTPVSQWLDAVKADGLDVELLPDDKIKVSGTPLSGITMPMLKDHKEIFRNELRRRRDKKNDNGYFSVRSSYVRKWLQETPMEKRMPSVRISPPSNCREIIKLLSDEKRNEFEKEGGLRWWDWDDAVGRAKK